MGIKEGVLELSCAINLARTDTPIAIMNSLSN